MSVELTPEMARDYFAANLDKVVGVASQFCFCPLAEVLRANGAKNPRVGSCAYMVDQESPDSEVPMDRWAQIFVGLVDYDDEAERARLDEPVMGVLALHFLDRALEVAGAPS